MMQIPVVFNFCAKNPFSDGFFPLCLTVMLCPIELNWHHYFGFILGRTSKAVVLKLCVHQNSWRVC